MNQGHIVQAAYRELRKIAEREGPEGVYLLERAEFTVDYAGSDIVLALQFGRDVVWKQRLSIKRYDIEENKISVTEMEQRIVDTMRKSLSVVGMAEHARLDAQFKKSIERVEVEYRPDIHEKNFKVFFKNGHVAEGTESEIRTDYFMARCTMIYDLPPL